MFWQDDTKSGGGGERERGRKSPPLPLSLSPALFLLIVALSACSAPVQLKGTDLGKEPAPDFQLTDQNGTSVSLTGLRGKVVVLTFLYTHCPDVCPLIAEHLRATNEQLGDAANQVAFVAVSIDPANDTPAAIRTFDEAHRLRGSLIYLNGTPEQLEPVWKAYYIGVSGDTSPSSMATHPELLSHSSRVVVIDKAGKQRVNLGSDFDPADLAYNVRALLKE